MSVALSDGSPGRTNGGVGDAAARAGGAALAAATALGGRLRRARKPLHPRGVHLQGTLVRLGSDGLESWQVPWLDEPGGVPAHVRLSRGLGVPPPWPDFLGLAIRAEEPTPADLLFTS